MKRNLIQFKLIIKYITLLSLLINIFLISETLASNLILKSNFGKGVILSEPYGYYSSTSGAGGAWQALSGIDSETGFDWSSKILGSTFRGVQIITMEPVDAATIADHAQNEIRQVVGPDGNLINELYLNLKKKSDAGAVPTGVGAAQIQPLISRPWNIGDVPDLYISYWYKHQADLESKLDSTVSSGNWRAQFEFKTGGYNNTYGGDYRIQTTIIKNPVDGKLYWISKGDNQANGPWARIDYWRVENKAVPVPIDRWFKFELYWHRSSGADGRYWAAVDGQVIADYHGPNMGDYNLPITRIFPAPAYSGGWPNVEGQMTGLEIWDGFPCGDGKSCFNSLLPAPPTLNNLISDQTWNAGSTPSFTIPSTTFSSTSGSPLLYTASLTSGGALPTWLSFNSSTKTFSAISSVPSLVATYSIRINAIDVYGQAASDDFNIKINNIPILNSAILDVSWKEEVLSSLIIPTSTFSDPDGDTLTFTATQTNGAALPIWMTFTASTRELKGTPPVGEGTIYIRIIAKDPKGLYTYDDFTISTPSAAKKGNARSMNLK